MTDSTRHLRSMYEGDHPSHGSTRHVRGYIRIATSSACPYIHLHSTPWSHEVCHHKTTAIKLSIHLSPPRTLPSPYTPPG